MNGPPDLFTAVRERNVQQVREILGRRPAAVTERDAEGATALHYATEVGDREIVQLLLEAGADINARDQRFNATPSGWAIEYLRQRGGLLAIEIEDASRAIAKGDAALLQRYVARFPALREAVAQDGTPLRQQARESGNPEIARLFDD